MSTPQVTWPDRLERWLAALESRHLADMRFSDVARALRALSSTYVERRERLAGKGSLDSPGKRAAFALFYAPLHVLLVRAIANELGANDVRQILDLGCGTGAAGAGWASACATPPRVIGLDRHPWTLAEATFTYRAFDLDGEARRLMVPMPSSLRSSPTSWTRTIAACSCGS
jgi:methylase of polypeptide subunit release factors